MTIIDQSDTIAAAPSDLPVNKLRGIHAKIVEAADEYDPASGSGWGSTPTSQRAALDDLHTRVVALEAEEVSSWERKVASGTLSSANLQAIDTPITLVSAVSGKLLVVRSVELFHDFDTAAYDAHTGDIVVEYTTSGTDLAVFADSLLDGATDDEYAIQLVGDSLYDDLDFTAEIGEGIQIQSSAAFAVTGGAAGVLKWRIVYDEVTPLS